MNTEVTIDFENKEYTGEYTIFGNMITVYFEGRTKQTQVDGYLGKEERLAKLLLKNLVREIQV